MEYNKNSVGTLVSPGSRKSEPNITHFRVIAKQTIRFSDTEAAKVEDEIFDLLKDFNCEIFSNFKGVDVFEAEIIETSDSHDRRIKETREKLRKIIAQKTSQVFEIMNEYLEESR